MSVAQFEDISLTLGIVGFAAKSVIQFVIEV
jgi:hypothetical protein